MIGYACINISIGSDFRSCRLATLRDRGDLYLKEIVLHNLNSVLRILKWNIENKIYLYRISSDIIPLASHPDNLFRWFEDNDIIDICDKIRNFKTAHGIRLSMHPNHFTAINTNRPDILMGAKRDLWYHSVLMDMVGASDMVLHTGGVYGEKTESMLRFAFEYSKLDINIRSKIRLENDDKAYNAEDVLFISNLCGVPICLDIHHDRCYPSRRNIVELIDDVVNSWDGFGKPKVHLSSGDREYRDRKHSSYIRGQDFIDCLNIIGSRDIDIMVESKGKDLAVLQLLNTFKLWNNLLTEKIHSENLKGGVILVGNTTKARASLMKEGVKLELNNESILLKKDDWFIVEENMVLDIKDFKIEDLGSVSLNKNDILSVVISDSIDNLNNSKNSIARQFFGKVVGILFSKNIR